MPRLWVLSLWTVLLTLRVTYPRDARLALDVYLAVMLVMVALVGTGYARSFRHPGRPRVWAFVLLVYALALGLVMLGYMISGQGYSNLRFGLLAWISHVAVCAASWRRLR